jgi:hypothetical protein
VNPIDDAKFPATIMANKFDQLGSYDVVFARNYPRVSDPPQPSSTAQKSSLAQVTDLLATYRAMKPAEQACAMLMDRYRFRMSVYQWAVRSALRIVWGDPFLSAVYWWAFPSAAEPEGAPSTLHGAVLAILAGEQLTADERDFLAGAWNMVIQARRAGRWSVIEWPEDPTEKQIGAIIVRLRHD